MAPHLPTTKPLEDNLRSYKLMNDVLKSFSNFSEFCTFIKSLSHAECLTISILYKIFKFNAL